MNVQNKPVLNRKYIDNTSQFPINIIQFGTGVLLRGLIDYIFQKANEQGAQNAVAMVKSTSADTRSFKTQDGVYTVVESGLDDQLIEVIDSTIVTCIEKILSAENDWSELESLFISNHTRLVVSNVTEAGLVYNATLHNNIPIGYPAKLAHLLHARYSHFKGNAEKGLIIIPTELLVDNGKLLFNLVVKHSEELGYSPDFRSWLEKSCQFCDSLVDRIVPGRWTENHKLFLPYIDNLAVATEPYYLWAIQGNKIVQQFFSKYHALRGFTVNDNITSFREQKLRLLNGCHTVLSPIAFAIGCTTVEEMMNNKLIISLFEKIIETEILPTLKSISPTATDFYKHMLSRWKNPSIKHELKSILVQSATKMQARNGETIVRFYEEFGYLPPFLTFGFAIFLRIYQPIVIKNNKYFSDSDPYPEVEINDQKAELLYTHWYGLERNNIEDTVTRIKNILSDKTIFSHKFVSLPGFIDQIISHYLDIEENGLESSLLHHLKIQNA